MPPTPLLVLNEATTGIDEVKRVDSPSSLAPPVVWSAGDDTL
jgi:hypothetical protein